MENAEAQKISRASGRFSRANAVALAILALGLTILGADKSPATCALQRFLSRGQASAVTSAEIADGYRMVGTDAGGPVEMPAGAVTNDLLRRRGGFDWAFRVEPDGWRSSWRDGFLTGVTVLARGEVRPDVGTLYYPVPVTNGVSLLPEARWGLFPNGCASVFSHAVTTNGSLLLDWRNALVERDPNTPTNMQMEIFGDGSFVWRTDGGSTSYLPVLPFDWDGDGLENSVDPEPLVPNPVDAHGTPAEWYRIVCSNVFTTAEDSNIQTFPHSNIGFRTNATARAYYFVDVVATEGPAPIYFAADRDSRLGSPVIVARAGETNRVPLLIGVEYAVTSTVPFSVTVPEGGFAEANQRDERNCVVKWPVNFDLTGSVTELGLSYLVNVVPYDPGGVFAWMPVPTEAGGARLLSASPYRCLGVIDGGNVTFGCSGNCGCGGCSLSGIYCLDGAEHGLPMIRCGCDDDEDDEDEDTPSSGNEVTPETSPRVSVAFSTSSVIFEDEYQNTEEGEIVQKNSTETILSISASGGSCGATLTLNTQNIECLELLNGSSVSIPARMTLGVNQSYSVRFVCRGANGGVADVTGRIDGDGGNDSCSANVSVVKIELQTLKSAPENQCRHRHRYGIGEKILVRQTPGTPETTLNVIDAKILGSGGSRTVEWGVSNLTHSFTISLPGTVFDPHTVVCIPSGIEGVEPKARTNGLPGGVSGGLQLIQRYRVLPLDVNFEGLSIEEVPCFDVIEPTGYFRYTPTNIFFRSHTVQAGAGNWIGVESGNYVGGINARDSAGYLGVLPRMTPQGNIANDPSCDWLGGRLVWRIPFGWKGVYDNSVIATAPIGRFAEGTTQEISIDPSGDFSVIKLQHTAIRQIDGAVSVDGHTGTDVIMH